LKTFCEIASKDIIPSIRALIALVLINKYNMTQVDVAKKLGVTQPAISYYFHSKRGRKAIEFLRGNKKIMALIENAAEKVYNSVESSEAVLCDICIKIRKDPELLKAIASYLGIEVPVPTL